MTKKQTKMINFIKIWFIFEFIVNMTTFLIYSYDCFGEKSLLLLQIASYTHLLVCDIVPIVNVIVLLLVSFVFEEKSQIKSTLLKGTGIILLLCVMDFIYRPHIPDNIGALNDYRNIFVLLFLPIISFVIVIFEIILTKNKNIGNKNT